MLCKSLLQCIVLIILEKNYWIYIYIFFVAYLSSYHEKATNALYELA